MDEQHNIAPKLRRLAIWIVIAVSVPTVLFFLAVMGSDSHPTGILIMAAVIAGLAIAALSYLDSDKVRNYEIEDPRQKWARRKRQRDLS